MSESTYLIVHKDHPFDISGANAGAEMATRSLAQYLAKAGKRVILAAQITGDEQTVDGVTYWSLGDDFNVTNILSRIRKLGCYHLISSCRAHALLEARYDDLCQARIYMSHNKNASDAGVSLSVVACVADFLVCVSNAHAAEFKAEGVAPNKLKVIHNGVDHTIFQAGDPKTRNYRNIVFAGALVQDKGIHLLIQSFIHLKSKYQDLSLDIYGSASLWGRQPFINEHEIQKNVSGVTFHGKVDQHAIATAYQKAGLCVVPSIWFEAFPLTAIEAQVTGCPVLAFGVGGLPEAVRHNETGIILNEISTEALTKGLDQLLADRDRLEQFSRQALATARPYFNWDRVASSIIELCEVSAKSDAVKSRYRPCVEASQIDVKCDVSSVSVNDSFSVIIKAPKQSSVEDSYTFTFAKKLSEGLSQCGIRVVLDRENNYPVNNFNLVHVINSLDSKWVQLQIHKATLARIPVVVSELPFHNFECRKTREEFSRALIEYAENGQAFCCPNFLQTPDISLHRYIELDPSIKNANALLLYGFDPQNPPSISRELCSALHVINIGISGIEFVKDTGHSSANVEIGFSEKLGISDFVLCVADFAPHNNQLMLLLALEHINLPLVLISRQSTPVSRYAKAVRSFHRNSVTKIIDSADDNIIMEALTKARVHALIAWNEPVDAINFHAALQGCNIVASKNSALSHMLHSGVYYCNQGDKNSINNAINAAYYAPRGKSVDTTLTQIPTWQETIAKTREVYAMLVKG